MIQGERVKDGNRTAFDSVPIMTKSFMFPLLATLALTGPSLAFQEKISSFLEFHCYDCHGDGQAKGGLDLEKLQTDLSDPTSFSKWELIYDRVKKGEMPPKKGHGPTGKKGA